MLLSVNIDHVATMRQARRGRDPEPVSAAIISELAGALGITVHLREDRRHMQERDLYLLREVMRTRLNVEVATTPEGLRVMREVKPEQVTLVPERPEEVTTEGGLDLVEHGEEVKEYIELYRELGVDVSLFINPDLATVKLAAKLSPGIVELNTAEYGGATTDVARASALARVTEAAKLAFQLKLRVHAGHDLNYQNAGPFAAAIPHVKEVSIGHAIIAREVIVGMDRAVKDMILALDGGGGYQNRE